MGRAGTTQKYLKKTPAAKAETQAPKEAKYSPNAKPMLTTEQKQALGLRREKDAKRPAFRRHEPRGRCERSTIG